MPSAKTGAATLAAPAIQTQPTFRDATEAYITARRTGWCNPEHAQQWANTLTTYAYPTIGESRLIP